eukprot:scaffold537_cov180-Ochromonas_danica.AAC.72
MPPACVSSQSDCPRSYSFLLLNPPRSGSIAAVQTSLLRLHSLDSLDVFPPTLLANTTFPAARWQLHLLEEEDLKAAADLALEAFYRPKFRLNDVNMHTVEAGLLGAIIRGLNFIDRSDAWFSNYIGFRSRGGQRLKTPSLRRSRDSLILAVTDPLAGTSITSSSSSSLRGQKIVGLVEVSMDEPTGLLSPPFGRLFVPAPEQMLQPYLCNLCVAKEYRRQGLGIFLCVACEYLAVRCWNRRDMYLHVEKENKGAVALYEKMGYEEVKMLSQKEIQRNNLQNIKYFHRKLC